jgi:hypothetical protein
VNELFIVTITTFSKFASSEIARGDGIAGIGHFAAAGGSKGNRR